MAHIRKIEDFDSPNVAELALIAACKAGEFCYLGDGELPEQGDKSREIRADLLRFLILGGCPDCVVSEGVELFGALITGTLDLSFRQASGPINLSRCRFEQDISLLQTRFDALYLNGSHLKAINAQGVDVKGDIFLRDGFQAKGEVRLSSAEIGGQLNCSKGSFTNPDGHALFAQGVKVKGDIFLHGGFQAKGEVSLSSAEIGGQLNCSNGSFTNPDGLALFAQGVKVKGDIFLHGGFQAKGEVSLSSAEIGGQLNCSNGSFTNPDGLALNAQQMSVSDEFYWYNVEISGGTVILDSAHAGSLADDLSSWPEGARVSLDGFII
ncbi:MAG: sRNA-binding regulator protein Hfq [Paracoccaceae bacterium]|jgi:sRNA-binding regulator protein Hfq